MPHPLALYSLLAVCAIATPLGPLLVRQETATSLTGTGILDALLPTPTATEITTWEDVTCDTGSLTSEFNNPWAQWNDSKAGDAWNAAVVAYENDSKGVPFGWFLSDFFHAPREMHCGDLSSERCKTTVSCQQGASEINKEVSAPGGAIIINSLVNLHTFFWRIREGIDQGHNYVVNDVGSFVDTFSPIGQDILDQKALKLTLDGIQTGLTLTLAPLFHVAFVRLQIIRENPNVFGTGIDISYGVLGTSMAFIKDAMDALSPLPIQNKIESWIGETALHWQEAVGNGTELLFNDPFALGEVIKEGRFLNAFNGSDPIFDIDYYKRAFFAAAMQSVWLTGEDPFWPVIVNSNDLPGSKEEGCQSWKIDHTFETDSTVKFTFTQGVVDQTRLCDDEGNAYWLIGVKYYETSTGCGPLDFDSCISVDRLELQWDKLTGFDKLDGSQFGGLTKEGIAFNAINSWQQNGQSNGWNGGDQAIDYESPDELSTWITGDLEKTRGIVNIPVCSFQEVLQTITGDKENGLNNPNYPCPLNNPLCNVPSRCRNAAAPDGCMVLCE